MRPRDALPAAVVLLAAAAAGCGDGASKGSEAFTKPSPTVAWTYEGLGADAWAARLSDPDPAARADAAAALASLGPAGAEKAESLRPLFADRHASVRFAALMAVQRLDDVPASLAADAVGRLADEVEGVRRLARAVAVTLGEKAVPALRALLASKDEASRRAALGVLAALKGAAAEAVPDLETLLRAEDAAVQDDAADTLAAIGAPALPALRRALADPRDDVATAAAIVLGRLGADASEAADDLATAAHRGPVRRVAVDALTHLGPVGRTVLERLAKDPDERLRAAASDALAPPH